MTQETVACTCSAQVGTGVFETAVGIVIRERTEENVQ
jgi:hypothetical protein